MRRGPGEAGNRAAKTSHSCQWREHAAEWCRCWSAWQEPGWTVSFSPLSFIYLLNPVLVLDAVPSCFF